MTFELATCFSDRIFSKCKHVTLVQNGPMHTPLFLPELLRTMPNLETLVVEGKDLEELPDWLADTYLKTLWLECPKLGRWLDSKTSQLPLSLQAFTFHSGTDIPCSSIPHCLQGLPNLIDLDIGELGRIWFDGEFVQVEPPEWLSETPLRRFCEYEGNLPAMTNSSDS